MTDFVERYATVADPADAFDRTSAAVGRLIADTDPARMGDPTPCTEWTVRDVLNHLVEIVDQYGSMAASGRQPQEGEVLTYADPVAEYPVKVAMARAAFRAPGYLDAVAETPIGPQPGRVVVQHVLNELVAHGWDLARATGRDTDLVPDVAEAVLASWRAFFDGVDRAELSFNFHAEQVPAAGLSAADRIAAFLGRIV